MALSQSSHIAPNSSETAARSAIVNGHVKVRLPTGGHEKYPPRGRPRHTANANEDSDADREDDERHGRKTVAAYPPDPCHEAPEPAHARDGNRRAEPARLADHLVVLAMIRFPRIA